MRRRRSWVWFGAAALAAGCFDAHGADRRDAGVDTGADAGTTVIEPPRDAGVRFIDPDAAPPDWGTEYGCHPETLFLPVEEPGCVAREFWGDELRVCEVDDERGTVGGRPVTVLNRIGKTLIVTFTTLEVTCWERGCIRILTESDGEACACGAGGVSWDPPADGRTIAGGVTVDRFVPAYSFIVGGEGVRWRVVACAED